MTDNNTAGPSTDNDEARWLAVRSIAELGELAAQFLEGTLQFSPTHGFPVDPETVPLVPVLAAANRAGFFTHQSQPGVPCDEHGSAQRANVSGFAAPAAFARLMTAASGADLVVTAARALDISRSREFGPFFAITIDEGEEYTWDGTALPQSVLAEGYGQYCHPRAVRDLFAAWQVTLIDPVWGRNDVLWPVLQAFADSSEHMTKALREQAHDQQAERAEVRREAPRPRGHVLAARRMGHEPQRLRAMPQALREQPQRGQGGRGRARRA